VTGEQGEDPVAYPAEYKDFVLIPDDRPGVLARLGEAAGQAGINLEGVSAFTGQGKGIVHLLVADADEARRALSEAGFDVRAARDVLVLDIEDRPGALGEKSARLAEAGINIEQAYLATNNRVVFAVDDIEKAREVFASNRPG
jgi:hypothetical protein